MARPRVRGDRVLLGGRAVTVLRGVLVLMPQLHLRAEPGDYAPIVLLPGDPDRATAIAGRFDGGLPNTRQVNAHRHLFGYTGTFRGVPISVQTTSMGAPAAAIVVEELLRLGARRLIRVGTWAASGRASGPGEIIIATAATGFDGTTATYLHGEPYAAAADFGITRALVDAAEAAGVPHHVGPICTVDVFYNPDADYFSRWARAASWPSRWRASAIFFLAARARARRRRPRRHDPDGQRRARRGRDVRGFVPAARRAGVPDGDDARDRHGGRGLAGGDGGALTAGGPPARRAGPVAFPVFVNLRSIGVPFAWWRAQSLRLEAAGYAGVAIWDHFVSRGIHSDPVLESGRRSPRSVGPPPARADALRAQRDESPPGGRRPDGGHPPGGDATAGWSSGSGSVVIRRSTRPTESRSRTRRSAPPVSRRRLPCCGRSGPAAR